MSKKDIKLHIEYLPLKDLIPYARNARKHSESQVSEIAASIREFGFVNPVIISEDKGILAGHGRCLAAEKLSLETVPCINAKHLSEHQRKAFILVDNRTAEKATWDKDFLKLELEELFDDSRIDMDAMGFDNHDLKELDIKMDLSFAEATKMETEQGTFMESSSETTNINHQKNNAPDNQLPLKNGAKEINEDDFSEFQCKCPRCGFEFDQE